MTLTCEPQANKFEVGPPKYVLPAEYPHPFFQNDKYVDGQDVEYNSCRKEGFGSQVMSKLPLGSSREGGGVIRDGQGNERELGDEAGNLKQRVWHKNVVKTES